MKKRILIVVGTRPNFIKITRFKEVFSLYPDFELKIAHTGQHYDNLMADVFFSQFNLIPDYFLNVAAGSPTVQIAEIMLKLEELFIKIKPDLIIVVGDVNSTLAAAVAANKSGILLAHLESGLRSNDRTMPEEFNRILTDELADYHFVTEQSGLDHLIKEGKSKENIFFVGNTMIDTLKKFSDEIEASKILEEISLVKHAYILMTMHRPATVDSMDGLNSLFSIVNEIDPHLHIVFPVHPRTLKNMEKFDFASKFKNHKQIILTEPLDYFSFQKLIKYSKFILTDSGGIQEETTYLQVPCLTLRPNTERPITITMGTNELIPFDLNAVKYQMNLIAGGKFKKGDIPPLWDGKATERIAEKIEKIFRK